jgi:glycosyltransferase involved in cell wall biosynthesis
MILKKTLNIDSLNRMKNSTLLILTTSFPNKENTFLGNIFVKTSLEEIRKYFKKVIVIAPVLFSFKLLDKDKYCINYSYENVIVYYPRCYYFPIGWSGKVLIDNRLRVVNDLIEQKNINFDIIHAHFTWPSGYIGVQLKEKYGKPAIITIHENGEWFKQEIGMDHPLIKKTWTEADILIRVNRKDVPVLQQYNDRVYSIPNGYSSAFHHVKNATARRKLGVFTDQKIIFSLGYLIKRKGFNYLIDAIDQICRQRDDVLCFIGGDGSEKEKLQKQIDRLRLGMKIQLLGSIPANQLTNWINACDLFVLPSLNEGNPTVMFEALGCGKPFIGTNVGGIPEIIISNEYGLIAEPGNHEDLAEKIMIALDRNWDKEKILAYAEQFSWENVVKEIMSVYDEVLTVR